MRKRALLACTLAAVLLVSTSLAGCGGSGDTASSGTATESGAASGTASTSTELADEQVVYLTQPEIRTLDSTQMNDNQSATVLVNTMEGLFRYSFDDQGNATAEKAGCTDYTVSDDGLTYTFTLRENTWSDGEPVTADDYVYAVSRLLDPDLAAPYAFFAEGLVNADKYLSGEITDFSQVGCKAVDDMTVQYTLAEPDSTFLAKLASPEFLPLRQDIVEQYGDNYGTDYTQLVFNGPFKITEWTNTSSGKFEKNESYWNADNVTLQEINMTYNNEQSTLDQLFKEGQLSQFGAATDYIAVYEQMAQSGQCQEISYPSDGGEFWISMSLGGGPSGLMSNVNIRRAVGLSIDGEAYCSTIYNRYTPADDLIPPAISWDGQQFTEAAGGAKWADDIAEYRNQPEKLQEMFKQGLEELGLQTDDLSQYTLSYMTYDIGSSLGKQSQEFIQQQIEQNLGINVELNVLSGWEQYGAEVEDGSKWDISMNGWVPDYNDPMTYFGIWETGGSSNYEQYANPEYDQLLKDAQAETDSAKRLDMYSQLDQMLHDDFICMPLYFTDVKSFIQPYIQGVQIGTMGYMWDYSKVQVMAH